MNEKKTAIVVSGMHRCGTSAVAGVLHLLGAAQSSAPMPTKADNPRGFFESTRIMQLNDRMLADAGRQWYDWQSLEVAGPGNSQFDGYREEALQILAREFAGAGLMLLKDPRFSRIMPFWACVLDAAGIRACHVIPVRHPDEAAASLRQRNALLDSMSKLAWTRHYLDAELYTRGRPRIFVHWPDFIGNWRREAARIAEHLGITWPRTIEAARDEVAAFLSPDLLHHRLAEKAAATPLDSQDHAQGAYDALQLFGRDPDSAHGMAMFDSLRGEFQSAERIGATAIRDLDAALRKIRAERDAALADGNAVTAELVKTRSDLCGAVRERESAVEQAGLERAEFARQAAELRHALDAARRRSLLLESRLTDFRDMNLLRRFASILARDDRYLNLELMTEALVDPNAAAASRCVPTTAPADLTLQQLLRLNGAEFLAGAYIRLLGREPDRSGLSFYLPRLMRGTPKIQILAEIGTSPEAQATGLTLPGLVSARRLHWIAKLPLLGAAVRAWTRVEGNSAADWRLRAVEQALHAKLH
jgi:hypothetical protein